MINVEHLQTALQQLNRVIGNQEQWHHALIRTIACRLPYDRRDAAENIHHECHFGEWYYHGEIPPELRNQPAFAALEEEHHRMHRLAARLLHASMNTALVPARDYDEFAEAVERFHVELYALKREFEDLLYGHDPLTGIENRISMLVKLRETLELGKRNVGPNSISIMDLDHFKHFNDSYGHVTGDRVLAAVARYVTGHLRPYDKVFRYGGEEFLILMPSTGLQQGKKLIERICNGLAAPTLVIDCANPVSITASFGIALLDPELSIEESIDRADKAMYTAKASGRTRVCAWDPSMTHEYKRPMQKVTMRA